MENSIEEMFSIDLFGFDKAATAVCWQKCFENACNV